MSAGMARIGLFGGSFNPVHNGHLVMAHEAREAAGLSELRFVPLNLPPHKDMRELLPAPERLELLRLACAGEPGLVVDDREIRRGGISWTIDTVLEVRAERPSDEICLLVGADSLPDLPGWRRAGDLARLVVFLVAARPGAAPAPANGALASFRIETVPTTPVGISSTIVRARVRAGLGLGGFVPVPVAERIRIRRWYAT